MAQLVAQSFRRTFYKESMIWHKRWEWNFKLGKMVLWLQVLTISKICSIYIPWHILSILESGEYWFLKFWWYGVIHFQKSTNNTIHYSSIRILSSSMSSIGNVVNEELKHHDTTVVAWQNIWEWGGGNRAYLLANAGYKVSF